MRIVRRLIRVLLIVLVLVMGAAAAAVVVVETAWFKDRLRGYIEREANQYLNGRVSIQRLGGNLFSGVELENIDVTMDGRQILRIKDVGLDYSLFEIVSKGLSVAHLRLDQPIVYMRWEGDGWNISRLVKKEETEADRSGPARPMAIDDIGISDGSVFVDGPADQAGVQIPKRFERIDAKLAFKYAPVRYSLDIAHISMRGADPEIALNEVSGGLAVSDDAVYVDKLSIHTAETSLWIDGAVQDYLTTPVLKLQVRSEKISLPEIARLMPSLAGIQLQPQGELALDGPLDRLGASLNVKSSAGEVTGKVVADVSAPGQSVAGDVSVRHLNLAPILNNPRQKSDITGTAHINLQGDTLANLDSLQGKVTLEAPRVVAAGYTAERVKANAAINGRRVLIDGSAAAYGATGTAAGRIILPTETGRGSRAIAYDLHGQVRHVDLRLIPRSLGIPSAATEVNAEYQVIGGGPALRGTARFQPSTVAGARIGAGSTVGFSVKGKTVSYEADASVANLDLQRIGKEFRVPALDDVRYKGTLNGHVIATGHGTALRELDLMATGTLTDSSILGGRIPQLAFNVDLAGDRLHVQADGSFADVDPAVTSGRPAMQGQVSGTLSVDAVAEHVSDGVTADSVEASAKVDLQPSSIGRLQISRARIDGDYHRSSGEIRALEIVGPDVNVTASGTVALDDKGQSKLTIHADSPDLQRIAAIVDQPVTGIATVDATVTGNKRLLEASGTLTGNSIAYKDNSALTLSSTFTVKVPDLTPAEATVVAANDLTFVSVGGLQANELTAKINYTKSQLSFDATAKEPQRSLAAAGSLLIHPDRQEVHLERLDVVAQNTRWQTPAGSAPVIQYGGGAIAVENLTLANGDQSIAANGRFGGADDALTVKLANVNLATVEALMLRPPQFTGTLNASSVITGTTNAPRVKADFTISQGGFRQFKYETFGGSVDYNGKGVTVDTTLQQNPTAAITVRGYAPMALFAAPTQPGTAIVHGAAVAPEDRVDLQVDSSPIDLAVVQGLTSELTNVKGTLEAHVAVTGSAADPHPVGAITVQNGAFSVPSTGVAYTNFKGKIDLQPEGLHIDEITVLDNQQSALSITGDLATHEGQVGRVQLFVTAEDFKIIDNDMGKLRINSSLQIAGELRTPRIEGDLGVSTGNLNLDPILAKIGDSAYATKPTTYTTTAQDQGAAPPANPMDALRMNLRLTVPNDLVIKASDVRTPGAPIGLGAINVTVGGDLVATKEPGTPLALVGTVNTVRGFYDFQGRRFDLLRDGTVRFEGLELSQSALDIRAQRVIQAVTANVNVRGTLAQPEIILTSTPPLEQADILSLIVFNQPINQLGEGQQVSLAQRAGALATGAVAGELGKSIERALNLDEFAISTTTEGGAAALLTVGQQLGQNLYVKVQQGIGSQNQTNVILEYELARWLRLQSNVLQGSTTQQQLFQRMQGSGVDMLFFFSF